MGSNRAVSSLSSGQSISGRTRRSRSVEAFATRSSRRADKGR